MLSLSAILFEAPAKAFLNQKEMCDWLDISAKTFRKYVRDKKLPAGETRDGKGLRHYWNQERAALARKIMMNQSWFSGELEPIRRNSDSEGS